jgi:hypothetical protein
MFCQDYHLASLQSELLSASSPLPDARCIHSAYSSITTQTLASLRYMEIYATSMRVKVMWYSHNYGMLNILGYTQDNRPMRTMAACHSHGSLRAGLIHIGIGLKERKQLDV